jgi:hypothetical protein
MSSDLHERSWYLLSEAIPKAELQFLPTLEVGRLSVQIKDKHITYSRIYKCVFTKIINFFIYAR